MFDLMSDSQAFGVVFFCAIGMFAFGAIGIDQYKKNRNSKRPQARRNKR